MSQNEAHAEGKSKLAWPDSKHNKTLPDGTPCAEALDIFQLCSNGMAAWVFKYCAQIASEATKNAEPIDWGGSWKVLGDYDHYQLK